VLAEETVNHATDILVSGLSTALPNRVVLTLENGVFASQAVLRANSGLFVFAAAASDTLSANNQVAIRSGIATLERVSDTVVIITPSSGLEVSATELLGTAVKVTSGAIIQSGAAPKVTPSFSNVPSVGLVTSGIASSGQAGSTFTIVVKDGILRSVEQGFSPSQISITGSGASAVTLAIANSQASAIQAALNNGNYTISNSSGDTTIVITGFGAFATSEVAVGAIKVSISRDAILTGSLDSTSLADGVIRLGSLAIS
jgi:hypothetical protein